MEIKRARIHFSSPSPFSDLKDTTNNTRPRDFKVLRGQGPVVRSLVSANRWLRGIKMYRFPWYLTLVSTNHASSNPRQVFRKPILTLNP